MYETLLLQLLSQLHLFLGSHGHLGSCSQLSVHECACTATFWGGVKNKGSGCACTYMQRQQGALLGIYQYTSLISNSKKEQASIIPFYNKKISENMWKEYESSWLCSLTNYQEHQMIKTQTNQTKNTLHQNEQKKTVAIMEQQRTCK